MAQGIAGEMARRGFFQAATMTLAGHHCILRTGEVPEIRRSDVHGYGGALRIRLRDTKVGVASEWTNGPP